MHRVCHSNAGWTATSPPWTASLPCLRVITVSVPYGDNQLMHAWLLKSIQNLTSLPEAL